MNQKDNLIARFKDLSRRAYYQDTILNTFFLSLSEINLFYSLCSSSELKEHIFNQSYFIVIGPTDNSERKVILFSYRQLTEKEIAEFRNNFFGCLYFQPINIKFSDNLTHRDFLGALMHLGFERKMFGDIYTDHTNGYVYLIKNIESEILNDLCKVKHTIMKVSQVPLEQCELMVNYSDKKITTSSLRIDCLIKNVFNISRKESQILLTQEQVFINDISIKVNSHLVKKGDVITLRHHGKFIYLDTIGQTNKGRLIVFIRRYQ